MLSEFAEISFLLAKFPLPWIEQCRSGVVLFGGDGDQLLGGLGDVVGTLDDLLRDQLDVRGRARVPREGLLAF